MEKNSDQSYIDRVRNGDCNAFAYLINRYKSMCYTLAIRIVKSHEDAEEVSMDSFLKAYCIVLIDFQHCCYGRDLFLDTMI